MGNCEGVLISCAREVDKFIAPEPISNTKPIVRTIKNMIATMKP